jgi:hypothetical protein
MIDWIECGPGSDKEIWRVKKGTSMLQSFDVTIQLRKNRRELSAPR